MNNVLKEIELEDKLREEEKKLRALELQKRSMQADLDMYKARFGEVDIMGNKYYDITISLDEYRLLIRENERLRFENENLYRTINKIPSID